MFANYKQKILSAKRAQFLFAKRDQKCLLAETWTKTFVRKTWTDGFVRKTRPKIFAKREQNISKTWTISQNVIENVRKTLTGNVHKT